MFTWYAVQKISPSRIRRTADIFRLCRSQKTVTKRMTEEFRQCKKGVIPSQIARDLDIIARHVRSRSQRCRPVLLCSYWEYLFVFPWSSTLHGIDLVLSLPVLSVFLYNAMIWNVWFEDPTHIYFQLMIHWWYIREILRRMLHHGWCLSGCRNTPVKYLIWGGVNYFSGNAELQ